MGVCVFVIALECASETKFHNTNQSRFTDTFEGKSGHLVKKRGGKRILERLHLKAMYITTLHEVCPNSKISPNAAHNAAFFSPFLEDALLLSFAASHIPRLFVWPKKEEKKKEMATLYDVGCHFNGPGRHRS